jgi:hypothetical protein
MRNNFYPRTIKSAPFSTRCYDFQPFSIVTPDRMFLPSGMISRVKLLPEKLGLVEIQRELMMAATR